MRLFVDTSTRPLLRDGSTRPRSFPFAAKLPKTAWVYVGDSDGIFTASTPPPAEALDVRNQPGDHIGRQLRRRKHPLRLRRQALVLSIEGWQKNTEIRDPRRPVKAAAALSAGAPLSPACDSTLHVLDTVNGKELGSSRSAARTWRRQPCGDHLYIGNDQQRRPAIGLEKNGKIRLAVHAENRPGAVCLPRP